MAINKILIRWLEGWTEGVIAHPKRALLSVLFISLVSISQIFYIQFDTSLEGFLKHDDPAIAELIAARKEFGHGEIILVTMAADDLFQPSHLRAIQQLHRQIEAEVPWLDTVTSLLNARQLEAEGDTLLITDLLEPFPQTTGQLQQVKAEALSNPLYKNLIISADGHFTTIAVKPLSYLPADITKSADVMAHDDFDNFDADAEEALFDEASLDEATDSYELGERVTESQLNIISNQVTAIAQQYQADGRKIYVGGMPVITSALIDTMIWEMLTFMPLAFITIAIMMAVLFRRRHGVMLPMMTVALTLLTTVGLISAAGVPLQTTMMILPSFLLTVSVGASVHLLTLFFRAYDAGTDKIQALREAMVHTRTPIIFTSLTTAVGLLSFAGSPMIALARLGLFSGIGIGIALVYTLTLVPALICLQNLPRKPRAQPSPAVTKLINGATHLSTRHPFAVVIISFMLAGTAITGVQQLQFSHNPMNWMNPDAPINQAVYAIDNNMGGSISVDIIIDSGVSDGIYEPAFLQQIEAFTDWLQAYEHGTVHVAKVYGINDIVKEAHKVLNNNDQAFYTIPDSAAMVANELFLIQNAGPDELEPMLDNDNRITRLSAVMPWLDTLHYKPFIEDLEAQSETIFGANVDVTLTGMVPVMGTTLDHVISTTAESYLIAFTLVSLMLIILLGSLRYGILAMIPNLSPILITMGLMFLLNIPLDMFTILVASIAIGIAVDDTVHFMYHCKHNYQRCGDMPMSIFGALDTSGRAMLTTSTILTIGFAMLMWSDLNNLFNFGMLIGTTVFLALIADFLFAPALMMLFGRSHERRRWLRK